jgi:DNA-binding transcriptional regulator YiaG
MARTDRCTPHNGFRDDMAAEFGVRRRDREVTALAASVFPQAYRNRRSRWLHVSTPLVTRWEHEGAPEPVLLLATALFEGIVKPQKTLPSPDLAALRQKLGLRQEDMAKKFGRRLAAYGEWERGKRQMPGWVAVYVEAVLCGWDEGWCYACERRPANANCIPDQ